VEAAQPFFQRAAAQLVVALQAQQAAQVAAPATPAGSLTDEAIAQLQKLADLQKAGILTDEEFAAQKATILNG
jgi:hypothetical protein